MKRTYIFVLMLVMLAFHVSAEKPNPAIRRIVLVGNTNGDIKAIQALRQSVPLDTNTILLFLGDDVSSESNEHDVAIDKLIAAVAGTGARCLVLPGNKDWKEYQKYFQNKEHKKKDDNNTVFPLQECPGPEKIDLTEDAKLIVMDTEWWLQEGAKPGMESDCPYKNEQQILDKLEDIVSDNRDKLLIFATHHPFHTTGIRSGYFGPKQHIFPLTDIRGMRDAYVPLPLVGSLYPILRGVAIGRQDMAHSAYSHMAQSLDAILQEHPFVIRVAGHEHVLELYKQHDQYYITSGAAYRAGRVVKTRHTPFAGRDEGFAVIDISENKKASVSFYEFENGKAVVSYTQQLLDFKERPPIKTAEPASLISISGDSASAIVYKPYSRASDVKRFFFGSNYRKEWSTPITVPIFHFSQDPRSFKIAGQGGGKQTTTIRLKDKDGTVWSLRSIVKDPEKVLAPALRNTIAEDVMKDLMSASHPFSSAVSNHLADADSIVRPRLTYYYVPDDTALGYYRPAFANTVVALEERQPSRFGEDTKGSWDVINKHLEKWKHKVDARSYLRARLMDILLADFDRHYEQWKWGEYPKGTDKEDTYYAIPKDRDQALFYSDGLLVRIGSNQGMSYLKGLKKDIANIKSLGFVSRDIDAFFLNELTRQDWEEEIDHLKAALTDRVISEAVHDLPAPAYAAHGQWIEERLRSRRDDLTDRAMKFYRFLAEQVNIVGSNKEEIFTISGSGDDLAVDATDADGTRKFHRVFSKSETDELYVYGLGGNDSFIVKEGAPRGIRIRFVGGNGKDVFDVAGKPKTFVYDEAGKGNTILRSSHTTNMISHRRDVNDYTFRENHYSTIAYPTVALGFNIDDGFLVGLGAIFTRRGFRANPFTSQHRFTTLAAVQHRAFQVKYAGTFNDAWRHFDVLANVAVLHPALQNFFGLGNETKRDTTLPLAYYRVRYSYASADILVRKRAVHNKLSIALGPSVFYYWNNNDRNTGRILNYASDYGLDSTRVFSPKFYAGGKFSADFNSIDNILLPTRGIHFRLEGIAQTGLNERTLPYYRASTDLTLYSPLSDNKRFVLGLRAGGGHIFSDGFEYWQALTLGANNFLRGFRKNRFSGTSMAYGSAELRWRLATFRTKVLPAELGLVGFQDAGRVWLRGEHSDKWHLAYGGGFYLTPFNSVLISVLGAISEEEQLINVSVGAGLNITF